ncbi:MAG: Ig-like domain-containing protein [Spirochaetia bacterium]|nr:Ig-like domain-containing protein [Spirochaetia bacterium]
MKSAIQRVFFVMVCLAPVFSACKERQLDSLLLPGGDQPPKVVATYPSNGLQGISSSEGVWVLFDRTMDEQKTQSSFRLSSPSGTTTGSFRWELDKMFFVPKDPLAGAGEFTMVVGRGSESIHGLDLPDDFIVRFFAGTDNGRPSLVSSNPADGATGVVATSTVTLTFSEPMDFSTAASGIVISPSFLNTMTQNAAKDQIIITPSSPLLNGTTYTITAKSGLKDLSGNTLAAEKAVTFTIGADTIRPTVLSVQSGALSFVEGITTTGVERATALTITFSEPMDTVTAENSVTLSPSVSATKTWDPTFTILTVTASLAPETNYTLNIDGTALDPAGNLIQKAYTFPFYTNGPTSSRPFVSAVYQQRSVSGTGCTDGDIAAAVYDPLSQFSTLNLGYQMDMQAGAGTTCVIELRLDFANSAASALTMDRTSLVLGTTFTRIIDPSPGGVAVYDVQVSGNVATIFISPAPSFPVSGAWGTPLYRLKIAGGTAKDSNNNTMASDYVIYFYF